MADKLVLIMACGKDLCVDRDPAYVDIQSAEQVLWMSRDGYAFDVEFTKETPFTDGHGNPKSKFHANQGHPVGSGPAKHGSGNGKDYKYTVKIAGFNDLDPTVRPTP